MSPMSTWYLYKRLIYEDLSIKHTNEYVYKYKPCRKNVCLHILYIYNYMQDKKRKLQFLVLD